MGPTSEKRKLLVQIASYNTNLQGNLGLPQNLVDWLSPTFEVSSFLSKSDRPADIVAVGFQELLPLHLGLSGISGKVIESRDKLIRSEIERSAPNGESYTLVAKIVNVGIALLVYTRDKDIGQRVQDIQTQWVGCGPMWMGNKGAVGIRFRLSGITEDVAGETFTFVNAHLTANANKLEQRKRDYHHIVATLLFPPTNLSNSYTTMYSTSHLFFFGDLNFRLNLPENNAYASLSSRPQFAEALKDDAYREELKEYDELLVQRQQGAVFKGLREGPFWTFKCTYKYLQKEIDKYNLTRLPAWTDRIMFTTYTDSPNSNDESVIKPVSYTSIPSYTTSDHKPIVALLLVPSNIDEPPPPSRPLTKLPHVPLLQVADRALLAPDPRWISKRYAGRILDRIIGYFWTFFWAIGMGNAVFGVGNFLFGLLAWRWMDSRYSRPSSPPLGDVEG